MINTDAFIKKLIATGYTHLCVVPCSFASEVINGAINNSNKISYIPCASEGVACSVAVGLKLSGQKPIIIVQSSGLTNLGSCITSLLKPYKIYIPILVSWRSYSAGDSEIQHAHLSTNIKSLIKSYGYASRIFSSTDVDCAMHQIKQSESCAQILLLKKNSFSPLPLDPQHKIELNQYLKRSVYLSYLNSLFCDTDHLFIGTTGNTAREMYSFMQDTDNFYMAGNMGGALSLGLGAALAGKKVFVCGGDAEFVMHMGGLTTAGRYKDMQGQLTYLLFDNFSNKSTGGQRSYQEHIDYAGIARSSGFEITEESCKTIKSFHKNLEQSSSRLKFIRILCSYDEMTPRPPANSILKSKLNFKLKKQLS
ncbi:thiamine pyrophosphate-dependent enzyme [Gammaproteobacteria bacterium]|nr:thiamine pyrophosphate-dependent enzyme [Gammaproteobacteria bacterium]